MSNQTFVFFLFLIIIGYLTYTTERYFQFEILQLEVKERMFNQIIKPSFHLNDLETEYGDD